MEALAGFIVGFILLFFVLVLLYIIPAIIVYWKLFTKAGKPGWAAIVPVYESIVMAEIAKKPMWLGVLVGVMSLLPNVGPDELGGIMIAVQIVAVLLTIYLFIVFAMSYNRGVGYWLLVIFLPIVAVFMTDKTQYKYGPSPAADTGQPLRSPMATADNSETPLPYEKLT